jgi:hypothetical protein
MKKFLAHHPYAVTSVIFVVLLAVGLLFLNWRKDDYMFMLLLYFIVTLGIRLDEISRQIGPGREASAEMDESVLATLKEIRVALRETNYRLKEIQNSIRRNPDG